MCSIKAVLCLYDRRCYLQMSLGRNRWKQGWIHTRDKEDTRAESSAEFSSSVCFQFCVLVTFSCNFGREQNSQWLLQPWYIHACSVALLGYIAPCTADAKRPSERPSPTLPGGGVCIRWWVVIPISISKDDHSRRSSVVEYLRTSTEVALRRNRHWMW